MDKEQLNDELKKEEPLETVEVDIPPKKKFLLRNLISTLLILAGLSIIAVPIIGRMRADNEQERMIEEIRESIALAQTEAMTSSTDIDDLNTALDFGSDEGNQEIINEGSTAIDIDFDLDHRADEIEFETVPGDATDSGSSEDVFILETVGLIEIEKLDLEYAIGEGTDLNTLRYSIGHLKGSADINSIGNNIMAGHRSHAYGRYFHSLDEMEIGDTIDITSMDGTKITYVVYETLIVDETDTSVLNGNSEFRMITLITCHPLYQPDPTLRLIVHAIDASQLEALDDLYDN